MGNLLIHVYKKHLGFLNSLGISLNLIFFHCSITSGEVLGLKLGSISIIFYRKSVMTSPNLIILASRIIFGTKTTSKTSWQADSIALSSHCIYSRNSSCRLALSSRVVSIVVTWLLNYFSCLCPVDVELKSWSLSQCEIGGFSSS